MINHKLTNDNLITETRAQIAVSAAMPTLLSNLADALEDSERLRTANENLSANTWNELSAHNDRLITEVALLSAGFVAAMSNQATELKQSLYMVHDWDAIQTAQSLLKNRVSTPLPSGDFDNEVVERDCKITEREATVETKTVTLEAIEARLRIPFASTALADTLSRLTITEAELLGTDIPDLISEVRRLTNDCNRYERLYKNYAGELAQTRERLETKIAQLDKRYCDVELRRAREWDEAAESRAAIVTMNEWLQARLTELVVEISTPTTTTWRCPKCNNWYAVDREVCAVDGTPRHEGVVVGISEPVQPEDEYTRLKKQKTSLLTASERKHKQLQEDYNKISDALKECRAEVEQLKKIYVHPEPSVATPCTICGLLIYGGSWHFAHPECFKQRDLEQRIEYLKTTIELHAVTLRLIGHCVGLSWCSEADNSALLDAVKARVL